MGTVPATTDETAAFFDGLVQIMITGDVKLVEAYIEIGRAHV